MGAVSWSVSTTYCPNNNPNPNYNCNYNYHYSYNYNPNYNPNPNYNYNPNYNPTDYSCHDHWEPRRQRISCTDLRKGKADGITLLLFSNSRKGCQWYGKTCCVCVFFCMYIFLVAFYRVEAMFEPDFIDCYKNIEAIFHISVLFQQPLHSHMCFSVDSFCVGQLSSHFNLHNVSLNCFLCRGLYRTWRM